MSLLERMQARYGLSGPVAPAPDVARVVSKPPNGRTPSIPTAELTPQVQSLEQPVNQSGGHMLLDFYKAVLPEYGNYCLFILPEQRHVWVDSLDKLATASEKLAPRKGVYFATSSFAEPTSRKQTNVLGLRSLRLDIDAGPDKFAKHGEGKVYATQKDALAATVQFSKAVGLTPSFIVSSGQGLHIYYALTETVTPDAWEPVAKALALLCVQHKFLADPSVTEDTARVLRPIGSLHSEGRVVSLMKSTGVVYDLAALGVKLGASIAPKRKYDLSVNDEVLTTFQGPPSSALKIAQHCPALREIVDVAGAVPEPQWRAMLGLVKRTVEERGIAHEWSVGSEDYDEGVVDAKFDAWTTGPTTCTEFAKHTNACGTCPHKGRIKSPIVLGRTPVAEQTPVTIETLKTELPDWKKTADGTKVRPQDTSANVAAIARIRGIRIVYNVMARQTEITIPGLKTERDDYDNAALTELGDVCVRVGLTRRGIKELADAVAGTKPYHPVLDWIHSKVWDQVPRCARLHETLELQDDRHTTMRAALVDAWCLQAIGALVQPDGIAAQGILVLNGLQDTQKTRWVANLTPIPNAVRTGLHLNPLDKDSVFQASSAWVVELGELDTTTRRAEVSALKAFITRSEDILRRPYAQVDNTYRRRTVFVGTVNGTGFLADDTGDRRFWVIAVKRCHLLAAEEMQQIWAEYLVRYERGDRWYLDEGTKAALCEANAAHRVIDPLQERIQTYFDWAKTTAPGWQLDRGTEWLSSTDICMRVGIQNPKRGDSTRAGALIRALNGDLSRRSNGATTLAVPQTGVRS